MDQVERERCFKVGAEARRLGFFGDTTLDGLNGFLERAKGRLSLEQIFAQAGVLSELELAVVQRDWTKLETLPRYTDQLIILRTLGEGAMGKVYQALETTLDRVVAIKEVRKDRLMSGAVGKILERFEREAKIMARLDHPAIVRLHSVGMADNGCPYMVMEYVSGRSLDVVIEQTHNGRALAEVLRLPTSRLARAHAASGPSGLELRRVAAWGQRLADALSACHSSGVVHRDIKPGNVLVSERAEVHLTDFGVAYDSLGERLTATGAAVGTPLYMAPELLFNDGTPPSPASDIYALGVTLYEAFCGQPPFCADNKRELFAMVLAGDPARLSDVRPDTPAELEAVIHKCLAGKLADRYADARQLADDLERFLDASRSPVAVRTPPAAASSKPERRNLLIAVVVLLLVALAALVASQL